MSGESVTLKVAGRRLRGASILDTLDRSSISFCGRGSRGTARTAAGASASWKQNSTEHHTEFCAETRAADFVPELLAQLKPARLTSII